MSLRRRIAYFGAGYLVSLMYSYGIAVSLIITHFLQFSPWDAFKYTALILLVFTVLFYNRWTSLAALIGAGIFSFWAIRYAGAVDWIVDRVPPFVEQVWAFVRGQSPLTAEYHLPLGLLFILVTILFSRISASRLRGCPSMLIVAAAVFIAEWSLGHHNIIAPMALSAASIAVVYAYSFARHLFLRDMSQSEEDYTEEDELFAEGETVKTERRTVKIPNATAIAAYAIPLAIIASLLATTTLPSSAAAFRWPFIELVVDDAVDYAGQFTGFSRKMYSFSISSFGYSSTSELGGPVTLSDRVAMVVQGVAPSLLKGSAKSYYTGRGWRNTENLGSYRFESGLWSTKKTEVFDLERPDPKIADEAGLLYRNIRLNITPQQNLYTIFSPTRPYAIFSGNKAFVPYFNQLGELYPKRKIDFGSTYTVHARQISHISPRVKSYIVDLEQNLPPEDAEKMDELRSLYLQLPADLPRSVRELGSDLADSAGNDSAFLRATAIKDYLAENFTYTLSPSQVPEGRDFVDYFLETGEGYCTYYATAMVVLARSAGIPARYVEGFLLTNLPEKDFVYTVTGESAHAWAELYFEGIGWIPFDATPIGQPRSTPIETPSEPSVPEIPIPSPEPSVLPPVEVPTAAANTPTWIIVLVIIAVIVLFHLVLITAHLARYGKNRLVKKFGKHAAVEIWWRSIQDMLPRQDEMFRRREGETSAMLSARIGKFVQCKVCTFDQLVRIVMRSYYSKRELTDVEIDVVHRYFMAMESRMLKTHTPPVYLVMRILFPRAFGFRGIKK